MERKSINNQIKVSSFRTDEGSEEFYITVLSELENNFGRKLEKMHEVYMHALELLGLGRETAVAARFYVSDVVNQLEALRQSRICGELKGRAVSIIQQSPLIGGAVSLLAYHIRQTRGVIKTEQVVEENGGCRSVTLISGNHYQLLWIVNFSGNGSLDAYRQTRNVFGSYKSFLEQYGMNMLAHGIRTWVYVRDLDNHYKEMVRARREFFEENGLTPQTRYIASTGIEGITRNAQSLVSLDAFSINRLQPGQVVRMEAPGYLCPTITYGVTFERGLRVRFGDRSHLYISGTASIDEDGKVVHEGDVRKQTQRTIRNVEALLENQNADFTDLAYLVIYLRSFKDEHKIMNIILEKIPESLPYLLVEGPVCRPEWLVEIEGVGIIPDKTAYPPFC